MNLIRSRKKLEYALYCTRYYLCKSDSDTYSCPDMGYYCRLPIVPIFILKVGIVKRSLLVAVPMHM